MIKKLWKLFFISSKKLFSFWKYSNCLLLRLKFRSARGASRHPAFMGYCQTISHTPHSPTYPVDEGSEVWIQSIAWGQCKNLEFGRLKLGIKMCNIASGKWDVIRVTLHKFRVGFGFLLDNGNCYLSVAQWLAQQNPTAEAPVRQPGGQNTPPPIFVISWTLC